MGNEFSEIISNIPIKKLNDFLNKNVDKNWTKNGKEKKDGGGKSNALK
jgi:hypothetical protein